MHHLLLVVLLTCISCSSFQKNSSHLFYGKEDFLSVMQGATDQTSTVINFLVPSSSQYQLEIKDSANEKVGQYEIKEISLSESPKRIYRSPWKVVNVTITGLKPEVKYQFILSAQSGDYSISQTRYFSTLNTSKKDWRLLIASCFDDKFADTVGAKMWKNAHLKNADAYFLIGDNAYADFYNSYAISYPVDPRHLWQRFVDTRLKLDLYRQKTLVPVFAMWDDHDYGENNGNKHFSLKEDSMRIFNAFFPMKKSDAVVPGPGKAFYLNLGQERFYFFDNRYFRDKKGDGDHLGKKQLKWFESSLAKMPEESRVHLVKGDQFFGKFHPYESYEGNHLREFKDFLGILKHSKMKFNFISGDRHYLELMKLNATYFGQSSFEITTSAMHAKLFSDSFENNPNPRRVGGVDTDYNYVIMNVRHGTDGVSNIQYNGFNEKDETLLEHKFHL